MLFSIEPFAFDPLLGFTSPGLYSGPAIVEAEHDLSLSVPEPQAVPEPQSLSLLACGLLVFGRGQGGAQPPR